MGAYSLIAPLGTGGMGAVYLARKLGLDEPDRYAIKVMLPHLSGDERFTSLFLHEARIATRVRHRNVCRVIDYGAEHGTYYIAMEHLSGRTLSALMGAICAAPPAEAYAARRELVSVLADVADGLEHAHELKGDDGQPLAIVHRDVCTPNIFVTDAGVAKILDFGIALYADRSFRTATGEMKGHLAYVAPELLAGMRADRRADVWSLAVLLWEAIALRRLFRRDSEAATINAVLHDPLPRLAESAPDVPPEVDAALARGLERERERRIESAVELVRGVMDALGFERARADEIAALATRWAPAEHLDTSTYSVTTGGLVDHDAATLLKPEPPLDPDLATHLTRRRHRKWPIALAVAAGLVLVLGGAAGALVGLRGEDAGPPPRVQLPAPEPVALATTKIAPVEAPPAVEEPDEPEVTAAPARPRRARARSGELVVPASSGWSEVWVDGERLGFSPLVRALPAGRHRVTLRRDGEVIERRTISIRPGRRTLVQPR